MENEGSPSTSNPKVEACAPNYAPFDFELVSTPVKRVGASVPFLDKNGLIRYPVDGTKLADATLMIDTYEAQDHFTRHLMIPNIRLSEWEAEASAAPAR